MKSIDAWVPSKFTWNGARLVGDRSGRWVSPGSILIVDLIAAWYQRVMPRPVGGVLVDLGCGRVPLYILYGEHVSSIICVDWSNSPHDTDHVDIVADLNDILPLPSASVDIVILSDVIEHIAKPWILWSEISRILRPGGKLIGNVPFMYWVHEAPNDYHRYTGFALRRYASDNGFEGEVEAIGGLLDVAADIFGKVICRIPLIGAALSKWISILVLTFGNTKLGTKARSKTVDFFPLAYGFVLTRTLRPGASSGSQA